MFNWSAFIAETQRTVNPEVENQHLNMALGLVGEVGELADELKKAMFQGHTEPQYLEEIGDILWYLANYTHIVYTVPQQRREPKPDGNHTLKHVSGLMSVAVRLLDIEIALATEVAPRDNKAKQALESEVISHLHSAVALLEEIAWSLGLTLTEASKHNVAKLRARYPDGFFSKDSMERRQ